MERPKGIVIGIAACTCILLAAAAFFVVASSAEGEAYGVETTGEDGWKTVTDMRGVDVKIPEEPQRVIALGRGLIHGTMVVFGIQDRLVGYGESDRHVAAHNITAEYRNTTYHCFSARPEANIDPSILSLPYVGTTGKDINFEMIAKLNPDLIIMRAANFDKNEHEQKTIMTIESLDIPIVVLRQPGDFEKPGEETIYQEIELLGRTFSEEQKAGDLIAILRNETEFIRSRTGDVPQEKRQNILYFGLSKKYRESGAAGSVQGRNTIESCLMEQIVRGNNVYDGRSTQVMSAEQVLALDPDVIVLPTCWGFHSPDELYSHEDFQNLRDLRAIKEKRVYPLPYTSCRTERLEFPITLLIEAKAAYPERFDDVNVLERVRSYYRNMYGINDDLIDQIIVSQRLDWMDAKSF